MKDNQLEKTNIEQQTPVLLCDRFLSRAHGASSEENDDSYMFDDMDQLIQRLSEHLELSPWGLEQVFNLSRTSNANNKQIMPRTQDILRDGRLTPKEGYNGTGN